jgi:hypothetical protein
VAQNSGSSTLSTGAIVAIVLCSAFAVAVATGVTLYITKQRAQAVQQHQAAGRWAGYNTIAARWTRENEMVNWPAAGAGAGQFGATDV